jgi:predicted ATP-dependent serine protease
MRNTASAKTKYPAKKKRLLRTCSVGNLYSKKFKIMELDGIWRDIFGDIEQSGCWLIWGRDKNGKTRLSAMLAKHLIKKYRVLYVSAEEGTSLNLRNIFQWAGFTSGDRMFQIMEYIPLEELKRRLTVRNAPNIVFIDNVTVYQDELAYGGVRQLLDAYRKTVFVFIAHEQSGEPYTATAKMIHKLATAIMRVQGLRCYVSGRVQGGVIDIDAAKANLFHGNNN